MKQPYNRLIHEKSPYLLQHAANPVDWHAWSDEAFEKAQRENKPIFLSIGYSTCHWCHVMEHECFEDQEVASLMNDYLVSIKVDREERPDLDNIYMSVSHLMTGGGGWPLSVFMTPDKKPFLAMTYIPKHSMAGRVGMIDLIPKIAALWKGNQEVLLKQANSVLDALHRHISVQNRGKELDNALLDIAYQQLASRFDPIDGGFSNPPKFPTPHNLLFLLRYYNQTGQGRALEMVDKTLRAMFYGGIYDHVGFGFHRYSTDKHWLLPHFEKMLYDQALLTLAYSDAYQAVQNEEFKQAAQEILAYVSRELTDLLGGFYCGQDADSEGVEGKFYVWHESEINQILGQDAELFKNAFNVANQGNFLDEATKERPGTNILHRTRSYQELADKLNMPYQELICQISESKIKLLKEREKRVHPHKDDKILTDWNGLMIAAFARASRVFAEPLYYETAKKAADFILKTLTAPDGRLLHRYRDQDAAIAGHVDDYAFLIFGLLELYETGFETDYLKAALRLNNELIERFWDNQSGGFYFTPSDGEALILRPKEIYDGAIPSGNSIAMLNLVKLSRMTANPRLEKMAIELGAAFESLVREAPSAYTQLFSAVDFLYSASYEVVIVGNLQNPDTQAMFRALRETFLPNCVNLFRPDNETEAQAIIDIARFTQGQTAIDGKATAYVCQNFACKKPTTDAAEMIALLKAM